MKLPRNKWHLYVNNGAFGLNVHCESEKVLENGLPSHRNVECRERNNVSKHWPFINFYTETCLCGIDGKRKTVIARTNPGVEIQFFQKSNTSNETIKTQIIAYRSLQFIV